MFVHANISKFLSIDSYRNHHPAVWHQAAQYLDQSSKLLTEKGVRIPLGSFCLVLRLILHKNLLIEISCLVSNKLKLIQIKYMLLLERNFKKKTNNNNKKLIQMCRIYLFNSIEVN